eukprot:3181803-Pyramimonas_sp.AAC.1
MDGFKHMFGITFDSTGADNDEFPKLSYQSLLPTMHPFGPIGELARKLHRWFSADAAKSAASYAVQILSALRNHVPPCAIF